MFYKIKILTFSYLQPLTEKLTNEKLVMKFRNNVIKFNYDTGLFF